MSVNYQRLYAYLVAQIDETLQQIAAYAMTATAKNQELLEIGKKLKNALLFAEDMYLDDTEER